jgi:hypothetical protein
MEIDLGVDRRRVEAAVAQKFDSCLRRGAALAQMLRGGAALAGPRAPDLFFA